MIAAYVLQFSRVSFDVSSAAAGKVVGDAKILRQILHNLVQNAIKFTDAGSVKVNISAETRRFGFGSLFVVYSEPSQQHHIAANGAPKRTVSATG